MGFGVPNPILLREVPAGANPALKAACEKAERENFRAMHFLLFKSPALVQRRASRQAAPDGMIGQMHRIGPVWRL